LLYFSSPRNEPMNRFKNSSYSTCYPASRALVENLIKYFAGCTK
jgi:hypothetical protein